MLNYLYNTYPNPWLDSAKRELEWDVVVFYTSAVLAFCKLYIPSPNSVRES